MKLARPKRRTIAIFVLWFVPFALLLATAGDNDSLSAGYGAIVLLSSALPFVAARRPWDASTVTCALGGFNTLASAILCLLAVFFASNVDGPLVLGLLAAALAGALAFAALAAPHRLLFLESTAALATAVALTLIAFDSETVLHIEGSSGVASSPSSESWSFLYVTWGFALVMFVAGAILALGARRALPGTAEA